MVCNYYAEVGMGGGGGVLYALQALFNSYVSSMLENACR